MRVNVYAEEMTEQIEIISKEIDGQIFTGLRIYLHLPVTTLRVSPEPIPADMGKTNFALNSKQVRGPFMHQHGDDDSSAVTFWGKTDLRKVLEKALSMLDGYYANRPSQVDTK